MAFFPLLRFSTDAYYPRLLVLCCAVPALLAFNLDVRFPVVKTGDTPGSLFGFSVALHNQTVGEKRYLLLVGAPKEKSEVDVKANITGGVYACPLNIHQSDCTRIKLVGLDITAQDRVEDMWLGVTVASQKQPGGRILTCGHRFVKVPGTTAKPYQMIGKCYIRSNNLMYDANDWQWQAPYEVCQAQEELTGGQQESMCGMGMSAVITDTEVIVGSPGSYEWQGSVNVIWRDPDVSYITQKRSFPEFPDQRNIYIGYSVAEGRRLLSPDQDTVVTGAPKDNKNDARGSVILALKGSKDDELLKRYLTIRGEQTGSYFGNSVAIADLNNDSWNDLIVGAPFYFNHRKDHGGAVYVYMNENGSFRKEPDITLRGTRDSAFGMAVASIGDINQDGFQDFAVGAPFQETGSVFIWTGSAKGISQQPSQVIRGKDIAEAGFQTFGYSISGGLDVDGNLYPDVVIGSLDNRVALLRARPIIHLSKSLKVTPELVDPMNCNNCVEVEVCVSYTISTGDPSFDKDITLKYTVNADLTRKQRRVRFPGNSSDSYTGFILMPSVKCQMLKLGLAGVIKDKVEPVLFSLDVSIKDEVPQNTVTMQNLDAFPVLSEGTANTIKSEIHFQKACGMDNRCQSNLQMKAEFANEAQKPLPSEGGHQVLQYSASVKKLLLVVEVTNLLSPGRPAEDAHDTLLNITVPPSLSYSSVRSKSNNPVIKCSEENRVLLCELGNPFASNQTEQVLITFETFNVSLDTKEISSTLLLSTLSEQNDIRSQLLLVTVEYTLETEFSLVSRTSHTYFSGEVVGESGMSTTNDIGSPVEYAFKVSVLGKPLGGLGNLEVEFDWPWELANGKWLLYLTEIRISGTSDSHCVPPGDIVNPRNFTLSEGKARRKRSEEGYTEADQPRGETRASLSLKGQIKAEYLLDCVNKAARCVKFICPLRNMNQTATITVRARVWNSTMLEDYSRAGRIIVKGQATLKLVTNKPTIKMATRDAEFSLNIDPELSEEAPYQVPLWIVIVSAVAGVLLLGFIIALLWKCGFFKRASTREMYEAKALKAEMKTQPSEVERLTEEN
ncbi:hypothetical protein DPEC_G00275630 [Dallia pectoralis]|uniref:Uncharacterized protein n=1 Tax=Dallia pectoralis TaxID=75939 RepID=A0ACC2FLC9_DALPE|nr:hypothetical protein DPEC_G00275630 [Dallia pectoralis]